MTENTTDDRPVSRHEAMRLFNQPLQVRSFILTTILVLMTFYTLYFARYIFIPLTLALLLNLLIGPAVGRLRRWHVTPPLGAALILGLIVGALGGAASMRSPARPKPGSTSRRN